MTQVVIMLLWARSHNFVFEQLKKILTEIMFYYELHFLFRFIKIVSFVHRKKEKYPALPQYPPLKPGLNDTY